MEIKTVYNHLIGKFDGKDYDEISFNNELFLKQIISSEENAIVIRNELKELYLDSNKFIVNRVSFRTNKVWLIKLLLPNLLFDYNIIYELDF